MSNIFTGLIQPISTTTLINNTNTSTSSNAIQTDWDIFPVGNTINPTDYVYDGQTILMVNSTLNPSTNAIKAQYFDPVTGLPGGFGGWSFDLTNTSYLNGTFCTSELLTEQTYLYCNMQVNSSTALGTYTFDVMNGGPQNVGGNTMFFSLTKNPYITYQGNYIVAPTINNVDPGYTGGTNIDNFLFTSNYYVQLTNEIIMVQLMFTVNNTMSTNITNTGSIPSVSVIVVNKVITKEILASLSTGIQPKAKVYKAGPIPLQFIPTGSSSSAFSPSVPFSFINNNVPLVIAPGYNKVYVTMPVIYVPPVSTVTPAVGQYLNNGLNANPGYSIVSGTPVVDTNNGLTQIVENTNFGHFVVGIAYSTDLSVYNPGANIYAEVLIKNVITEHVKAITAKLTESGAEVEMYGVHLFRYI